MSLTPDTLAALVIQTVKQALIPVKASLASTDTRTDDMGARVMTLEAMVGTLRERLAVLETRAPIPGPPGLDGAAGRDGQDGLGFEDFSAEYDGDRTVTLHFSRGTVTKAFPFVLPIPRYVGVFSGAQTYRVGEIVTWGGSTWHCQQPTSAKPDDASPAWRLMVKRGRDGRDGRPEAH